MKTIEFFFDFSSPYSYLTATQLEQLAQRTGAQVIYKPMVLAAVFKATGNTMPAVVPAKARHMLTDLTRWAAEYGVPFQMSSRFPVNGIKAARMVIGAEAAGKSGALTQACFAALWTADRDITADAELRAHAFSTSRRCGADRADGRRQRGASARCGTRSGSARSTGAGDAACRALDAARRGARR